MRAVLLAAVVIAIFFAVAFLVSAVKSRIERRRTRRMENPMLAGMTRHERRAYAKELREREQEQYDLKLQQDLLDLLQPQRKLP